MAIHGHLDDLAFSEKEWTMVCVHLGKTKQIEQDKKQYQGFLFYLMFNNSIPMARRNNGLGAGLCFLLADNSFTSTTAFREFLPEPDAAETVTKRSSFDLDLQAALVRKLILEDWDKKIVRECF